MVNLQKVGAIAAAMQAILYIGAFIYFGAILNYPSADTNAQLQFLSDNQFGLAISNLLLYVLFGIVLAVLVLALHERLKQQSPLLMQLASLFGYLWVGLVIAAGMIANISQSVVLKIASTSPEQAKTIWLATDAMVEGIGGGNEIVGGLWVLLLSIAALRTRLLSKGLTLLGLLVGIAGTSTIYPAAILTEIFGISQIVWFIWLSIELRK